MALATVIGIVTILGIIAATLAVMTVFATGYTSSKRASVQARAAAEAGIDYARTELLDPGVCRPGERADAPGVIEDPRGELDFTVHVWHQLPGAQMDQMLPGCPTSGSSEVRLQATGSAAHPGVAGQTAGDTETMDSVYRGTTSEFTHAEVTTRTKAGGHLLNVPPSTQGQEGQRLTTTSGELPRLARTDYRWSSFEPWPAADLARDMGSISTSTCSLRASAGARAVQVTQPRRVDCSKLSMSSELGAAFDIELWADLVLFADEFELAGTLNVTSGDSKPHTLYIVRPWANSCSGVAPDDVRVTGGPGGVGIRTARGARVMLYSGTGIAFGTPGKPEDHAFAGQVYACTVAYHHKVSLTYAPANATILGTKQPWPPTLLVSKRGVPTETK